MDDTSSAGFFVIYETERVEYGPLLNGTPWNGWIGRMVYHVRSHLDDSIVKVTTNKIRAIDYCFRLNVRARVPFNPEDYRV